MDHTVNLSTAICGIVVMLHNTAKGGKKTTLSRLDLCFFDFLAVLQ